MTNRNHNDKRYTLLVLDEDGNVCVHRVVEYPRLQHSLDEVPLQVQDLTHPGLLVQTRTGQWFTLKAKLVEEK